MSKNVVDMTLRANMDLSQVSSGLNQMQGILKQLKLSPTLKKEFDSLFASAAADLEKYQAKLQSGFKTKGDIAGFEKLAQGLEKSLDKIGVAWSKLQEKDLSKLVKLDSSAIEQIQQIENKFKELEKTLKGNITNNLKTVVEQINSLSTKTSKQAGLGVAEALGAGEYKEALALIDEYITKLERMGAKARGGKYEDNLQIFQQMREGVASVISETDKYNQKVNELKTDKLTIMADAVDKTGQKLQQGSTILSSVTQKTHEYSKATQESAKKTVELSNDLDILKSRVQHFFSLTNSVMLFRRILQDTIQTTKELDAAMTETAVVTDFSVADMWKDLPRYTDTAKELGATIQGVYETMTLYYQQGLKTNEVFEVGTETLKMARIAGLDYAQATDFMTAALRGFNMEVNELNAQKVNDVYSELAAITAADTQEIATAMTKTASIASSANMEFETTAAFLSQIIETTRESAETAGTALKTVIARFTELKKDPAEIGEVDGEIVDANKIETALRTIGIALKDTSGQFRDLDDVFLDIAAKWEGLDTNTQRYIATMAAGSRQQSRFIAMMSDYSRTMELVNAANNSAGASQQQFDKTLESLEAKTNRLKDAWDQFIMGIADSSVIKGAIDLLTGFINILNKVTEWLPGATKGIGRLLVLFGGFTAAHKVFRAFSASVLTDITALSKGTAKAGQHAGESFFEALKKEFKIKRKLGLADFFKNEVDSINKMASEANIEFPNPPVFNSQEAFKDPENYVSTFNEELKKYEAQIKNVSSAIQQNKQVQQAMNDFTELGIQKEVAATMAKRGLTLEEIKAGAAKKFNKEAVEDLTEEEIQQYLVEKMTSGELTRNTLLTKLRKIAYDAETGAVKKNIVAKTIDWVLTKALNKEWLKLFAAIAVVVGVIALVVGSFKLLNHLIETNTEKQERLNKAVQQTGESMNDAKTKIDDIKSAMEELGGLETEFSSLIKGTDAWKEKLIEVNNKVLELLQTYPTLAQYVSQGANGELTISSEGWDEILKQQQEKLTTATYANTIARNQQEVSNRYSDIEEKAKESGLTKGGASANDLSTMAAWFGKRGRYLTADQNINELPSYLQDDLEAVLEKDNGMAEFNKLIGMYNTSVLQTQKSTEALATQLVSQNEKVSSSQYGQGIAKAIASQIEIKADGNLPTEVYDVLNNKYGTYELNGQAINLDKSEIWKDYAAYSGQSLSEIKEKYKDDDDGTYALALELASQDAAEKLSEGADLILEGLNKLGKEISVSDEWEGLIKNLFSGTITEEDIAAYTDYSNEGLKKRVSFNELPKEIQDYFDNNSSKWTEFLNTQMETAKEQKAEYESILTSLGVRDNAEGKGANLDTSKLSTEAVLGLAQNLEQVYYKSGKEGVNAITEAFNSAINGLPKEEAEKVAAALNGVNWDSFSSIEDLKTQLKEMGITIDDSKIEALTTDIIKFNKAVKGMSLEDLTKQLEKITNISDDLEEREYDDREFTKEEKEQLTSLDGIDESMFIGFGDSWMYVGDSLVTLEEAVRQNTAALIESTLEELRKEKETADFVSQSNVVGDLKNYGTLSTEDKQALLSSLIGEMDTYTTAEGKKLTQLGNYDLKYLNNLTSGELDPAQTNFLNEFLSTLSSVIGQGSLIQAQIDSSEKQLSIQKYSSAPLSETADVAINSENKEESDRATDALLHKAAQYTQLADEIKKYNKALESKNEKTIKEAKQELAASLAIAESAKKIDKYSDKIQDNIDALEDMNDEGSVYQETLEDTATLVNEMMDADIDASFFSGENAENLQLLQKGLDGTQESWNQFLLNLQDAKIETSDFANQFEVTKDALLEAVSQLDASSFDINGTADMTNVVQSLLDAGMTGAEVAEFLELLGYTNIELEVDNNIVGLDNLKNLDAKDSLSKLGGSVTVKATNSYVPAAGIAKQFGGGSGSGGSGSNSGSEKKPWENPYNSFYNITEKINELLDERNELEKEYDLLLKNENSSINDFINSYKNRLASYYEEIALQKEVLKMRQDEQDDILSRNSHLSKYAWVEDGAVYIDFKAVDQVEDQELGEEIEEYINTLEENDEAIQEANDAINENTLAIEDLIDEWRDTAASFEERIYNALEYEREQEIEKTEEIFNSLTESNNELIDAIQEQINLQRQERENEETERDIAEKEKRLAFLSQDTSGAYDQEILQLQKELTDQKEDYTDTLIDQKISELQRQNEEAAKQRDKQIQVLQYQLQNDQQTGKLAEEVRNILQDANSPAGWNRAWSLLEKAEGFKGLTDTNKQVWVENTKKEFKEAMAYLSGDGDNSLRNDLKNNSNSNLQYTYTPPSGSDGSDGSDGSSGFNGVIGSNGSSGSNGSNNANSTIDGFIKNITEIGSQLPEVTEDIKNIVSISEVKTGIDGKYYKVNGKWYKESSFKNINSNNKEGVLKDGATGINNILVSNGETTATHLGGFLSKNGANKYIGKQVLTETVNGKTWYKYNGDYFPINPLTTDKKNGLHHVWLPGGLNKYTKYKTGGLADFTGPAWLDGTKSKPELVLNQKDTQNFLQLKDVLSSFMKNSNEPSQNFGDTTYDISINVDKVTSDYDVDQIASKIKQIIASDASYRNSNLISRIR